MERPDPDELLDKLQRSAEKQRRGRLKIFFGACAGVGKTFAMLKAARCRQAEGEDVVVGIVETHGRAETADLLAGLEVLPRQKLIQHGRQLSEFDLDAALARKPALILVDELAHTNVAGARHLKRWQDVCELLEAGIDVDTTINVQHLGSLNDIVGRITGIQVREIVPDHIFDLAEEVMLVDLPAEELLTRLRDGKVYLPQQAERATQHFFRKGNLIALRELALRRTADRVDAQMREYRADRSIQSVWQARERLLVCLGPGPENLSLVRAAARLAAALKADWIAAYVETPKLQRLGDAQRTRIFAALKLAQELGAETVTPNGSDVAAQLTAYARLRNVSKFVVGAPSRTRLANRLSQPLSMRLLQQAADIDLILIATDVKEAPATSNFSRRTDKKTATPSSHFVYHRYLKAGAMCALITWLATTFLAHIDLTNLAMLYLLGVIFAAARLGRGPGVCASFLSVAAFDFFFVPPRFSLAVSDAEYLLTFLGLLATSLVISHLTSNLRREARIATYREQRTSTLYAMTRELAAALTTEQIIEIGSRHISEIFQAKVSILLPDSLDRVRQKIEKPNPPWNLDEDQIDLGIAQWTYNQAQAAGQGTDTLMAAPALYLPLKAPMRTRGVLTLIPRQQLSAPEQKQLLDTLTAQVALALERVHYVEVAQDALVSMESERMRNALLAAISHDLRTPLTSIVGFASMLMSKTLERATHSELVTAIHDEALAMNRLVTNLLDMARLQTGEIQLNRQWLMLEEVIGSALHQCRHLLAGHLTQVQLPPDLPLLKLDAVLIERLLVNLLENAAKYTPRGTRLEISATSIVDQGQPMVRVTLDDQGLGLPLGMETRIFEKFTRGAKELTQSGVGLGLAICRAIVAAHQGTLGAENLYQTKGSTQPSGARFWFTLPLETSDPIVAEIKLSSATENAAQQQGAS
ncbi:osmosensitive K+ channel histidine kinase [Mycoavidus cysteinexigens]|uniref:histidine kinase n=1 Tax=Mycoavidus cysteinexigens TaxID=1553431 RepID=A0A2Z6EUF4_9BURK|nr:DUF4118 domain-containing protein [Mycoavidus cysteinexigens]BBE09056.1 osmosensitive K+ channel histidine kinase [Mycoavidus cysteinexigens]GAM52210.1 osmosensitive K+ channel histidine kinase KdpD [bacterium endosymbiont of Mortierella elongata FMR23-6]GLR00278.1 two-component sensor histidine kinase [Mycoavidus cysteinexigens]